MSSKTKLAMAYYADLERLNPSISSFTVRTGEYSKVIGFVFHGFWVRESQEARHEAEEEGTK